MFLQKAEAQARYDICKACEFFKPALTQCKECGCFMKMKVKLEKAQCPKGKWS